MFMSPQMGILIESEMELSVTGVHCSSRANRGRVSTAGLPKQSDGPGV